MKKKWILLLAATMGILAVQPVLAAGWQEGNPLVAHALGEVDGKIETNSKEAFINAWSNGFRVMEADFVYTSDGVLVVRHDFDKGGSYVRLEIEPNQELVMDSKTFQNTPIFFSQTPLRAVDLLHLMVEYPDVYLITDTKSTDQATVKKQFQELKQIAENIGHPEVLDRMIPQIYDEQMLGWVREIHPFENWIFTLYLYANPDYDKIAAFCVENGIETVTLHQDRATKGNVDKLKAKGLKVYAHTTNRYLTMKELLEKGVDGIYTDRIKPYELPWIGLESGRRLMEKTYSLGEKEKTFTTLEIFGEDYAPLRQLAETGKGFSVEYNKEEKTLLLQMGRVFRSVGNELLLDDSGRLITQKADFILLIDGKPADFSCFLVDGEVYAPIEKVLPLIQK